MERFPHIKPSWLVIKNILIYQDYRKIQTKPIAMKYFLSTYSLIKSSQRFANSADTI